MADKRISQLAERTDIANNDVVAIVASGATVTNKATISSIQSYLQTALDVGVTSVGVTISETDGQPISVTGSPITTSGNITINLPRATNSIRGVLDSEDFINFSNKQNTITLTTSGTSGDATFDGSLLNIPNYTTDTSGFVTLDTAQTITGQKTFSTGGGDDTLIVNHTSGSGIALDIAKAGDGEGLRVAKTSGSGNAVTITGGLLSAEAATLTGALNGTSAVFTGNLDVGGVAVVRGNGSSFATHELTTGAANVANYLQRNASGTTINQFNAAGNSFINGGNVGIGTTAPSSRLEVRSDSSTNVIVSTFTNPSNAANTTKSASIDLRLSDTVNTIKTVARFRAYTDNTNVITGGLAFDIRTADTAPNEVMRITSAGNVGIGTDDPIAKLEVNGTARITGSLRLDSTLNNGTHTYNLPSSTGTLALTSDLHAALTLGTANGLSLTGQILSLALASTSTTGALSSTDYNTFNNKEGAITAGTSLQYFRGDKTFQTLNTAAVPELTNLYFTENRVRTSVLTGLNLASGGTIAATDNVLVAFGKVQNQISALVGGVMYDGLWNASTNTPTLVSSTGTKGEYYVVSVDGSTNLNGITDWKVGDWAIFNGSTWDKVDNTDAVSSVNGYLGAVSLVTGDVLEGAGSLPSRPSQLYFTNARSRTAISFIAGSGAYNSSTGVITIPTNNNQITNGAGYTTNVGTVISVSGTGTVSGLTLSGSVNSSGNLTLGGTLSLTSNNVTDALGFTPYNATNPSGFTSNVGTVTSVAASAGTGISISGSPINSDGTLNITNTAPDQVVVLTAGTGISTSGTYPNFTITNTSPSSGGTVTSVSGTGTVSGLTLSGTVSLNGDLTLGGTLSLTSGNVTDALGFTPYNATNPSGFTSNVGTVTNVTASAPLASSGGATPNLSITQASGSTNGFLSSTDFNTFNNKAPSVAGGYLPLSGGTLTGALNGTSAVFSQGINVTGNGGFFNAANKFGLDQNGITSRFYANGSNTSTRGQFEFHINSSDGSLDTTALAIASTGAATFSSSVTLSNSAGNLDVGGVAVVRGNGSSFATHELTTGAANVANYLQKNASGTTINQFNAAGDSFINGGNVGIGTTTPSAKLEVNGAIKTSNPSGSTARPFKIGSVNNESDKSFNGNVLKVEVNGVIYRLMIAE